jgi:GNAT superfamily N-acetyltransferase
MAMRPVEIAELQSMYVAEGHRSNGLGRDLVERFRAWARDLAAEQISVTAYADNERAVRFYERMGFSPKSIVLETSP